MAPQWTETPPRPSRTLSEKRRATCCAKNEQSSSLHDSFSKPAGLAGASLLTGGERSGAIVEPAVVADVDPSSPLSREELFGPAVAVTPVDGIDEAIAVANDSSYGLGAGIFTSNVTSALRFAREVECGSIQINWTPLWRADAMPYGGLKGSGFGRVHGLMRSDAVRT